MRIEEFEQLEGISDIKQDKELSPIEPPTLMKANDLSGKGPSKDSLNKSEKLLKADKNIIDCGNFFGGERGGISPEFKSNKENISHNIPVKTKN